MTPYCVVANGTTSALPDTAPPVEKLTPALDTESTHDHEHMDAFPSIMGVVQLKAGGAGGGGELYGEEYGELYGELYGDAYGEA